MIEYSEKSKTFVLRGKNYAYIMYVGASGFLQHIYYGKALRAEDTAYLLQTYGAPHEPQTRDGWSDGCLNELPSEYAFFGRGDYREPTVTAARQDGARMSRFCYVSHTVQKGAPALSGLPHARTADETLCIVLQDDFSPLQIRLFYAVSDDTDILARHAELINTGKEDMHIEKAFSFCVDLPDDAFDMLRLHGNQTMERTPERTPLGHGITRLHSLRGASSHQMNPFAALLRRDCTETQGECYGFQLVYSGSWAITAEVHNADTVRMQGGINDTAFNALLASGQTLVLPQALLAYSCHGLGELSRAYARFIRTRIMPPRWANASRPIVVNNWEATYFDFSYDNLFPIIDEAAACGADTFVLDDGWFGKRDKDDSSLGDWTVHTGKLPQGLTPLIDRCKQNNIKFGLWFEPEMVCEKSELYRAHPDWAIGKAGQPPYRSRSQLTLDLTRKEVVDHVFEAVGKILRENEISYVKWDMNRSVSEFYSHTLPAERQGEFAHRYILGVYDLAERLTSAFPHVFFEGCASGGGRFDAGMLYYFPQIWTSDNTDAYERARIQWGTSVCYPLAAMSCHVSACPNHQTGRTTPLNSRGAIASLGATGYELDLSKLTEQEKATVREQIRAYKEVETDVLQGDVYRLLDPFAGDRFCMMTVRADKTAAYVVGEGLRAVPNGYRKDAFVRLQGLNENKTYRIAECNVTASGAALMRFGVALPQLFDYQCFVWHIAEVRAKR
ncbi:MAG: alpha-galactosidase [Clostridia bacterium]|nr:alpha-galactosidase [Clostridia bacterium]